MEKYKIVPALEKDAGYFFAADPKKDRTHGCIGHVRIDFGRDGDEFWHTWWPRGPEDLNSEHFKEELSEVVNQLRESVLKSLPDMRRFCQKNGGEISGGWDQNYGYEIETDRYRYCLRCNPVEGDYQAYLTCYDKLARQLVGQLSFINGDVMSFYDENDFLATLKEELPYRPTTGLKYEIHTDDSRVWKAVDDIIYDLFGEQASGTYEITDYLGNKATLLPRIELYEVRDCNGRKRPELAIVLDEVGRVPGETEQYAVLTVSFGSIIPIKNAAYVDVNNCGFAQQLLEQGIAQDTGAIKQSGFCEYPLWIFDERFLREHSNGKYEQYTNAFDKYIEESFQNREGLEMTMKGM